MTFLIHVNKLLRELFGPNTVEEDIISRAYYMSKIDSTEVMCGNVRQMIAHGWFVPPSTSIYYSCDDDHNTTQPQTVLTFIHHVSAVGLIKFVPHSQPQKYHPG